MRPARLARLPWQLTCLLLAARATADIAPSNTSTARPDVMNGTLPLIHADGVDRTVADLIPLTQQAANSVRGDPTQCRVQVLGADMEYSPLGQGQSVQHQLLQRRKHLDQRYRLHQLQPQRLRGLRQCPSRL